MKHKQSSTKQNSYSLIWSELVKKKNLFFVFIIFLSVSFNSIIYSIIITLNLYLSKINRFKFFTKLLILFRIMLIPF